MQRWCSEMYVDACLASAMLSARELASVLQYASRILRPVALASIRAVLRLLRANKGLENHPGPLLSFLCKDAE